MKRALKVANVLSWFSVIFIGINVVCGLLLALAGGNPSMILSSVIVASIPLHSYAALQLHRSIRRPETKLSHQTPAGIRFVGLVAFLLGALLVIGGAGLLGYAPELYASMAKEKVKMPVLGDLTIPVLREVGGIYLTLGLVVTVNVILNLRLLRWYYLVHQSDAS